MKPNHICKYSKCNLGKDGGRKHYYACDYCDASANWKSMACCWEHYVKYQEEILLARSKGNTVDLTPERTDISKEETEKLMKEPLKKVAKRTKRKLKAYANENGEVNINEAVDKINEEIDKEIKNESVENNVETDLAEVITDDNLEKNNE